MPVVVLYIDVEVGPKSRACLLLTAVNMLEKNRVLETGAGSIRQTNPRETYGGVAKYRGNCFKDISKRMSRFSSGYGC